MLIKSNKFLLLEYFLNNPTAKERVRGVARKTNLPLPSISRYLKELEEEGFLKKEMIAGIKLFSADRFSKNFLIEKKLYNLKQIYLSGLIEYIDSKLNGSLIILFGSYLKGEDVESSDIDLFIETTNENMDLTGFEDFFGKSIHIFAFKDINDIKNKKLLNNILSGMVLGGNLEVFLDEGKFVE
jgi:predicted nucleotidyltransferase